MFCRDSALSHYLKQYWFSQIAPKGIEINEKNIKSILVLIIVCKFAPILRDKLK